MYERILKIFLVLIVLSFILISYLFVANYSLNKEIETMKKDISSNKIAIENKGYDVKTTNEIDYSLNKEIETMKKDISSNKIAIENKVCNVETMGVPIVEVTPTTDSGPGGS